MKDDIQIEFAKNIERASQTSHRAPVMEQDLADDETELDTAVEGASEEISLEQDVSANDIRDDIRDLRQALAMSRLGDSRWIERASDRVDTLERHFDRIFRESEKVSLA